MTTSFNSRLGTAPEEGMKAPCVASSPADITLSGEQTIDTVAVVAGDRVLVRNQTDASENGIYDVAAGAWTRSTDWNNADDLISGQLVSDANSLTIYQSSYAGTIVLGATDVNFSASSVVVPDYFGIGAGTVDVITVALNTTVLTWTNGLEMKVRALGANTSTTPTINPDGIGAKTITKLGNQALLVGDIPRANFEMILRYNSATDKVELLNYNDGFKSSSVGSVVRTVDSKLNDSISVFDFMTTAEIADVQAGTALVDVSAAVQAACDAAATTGLVTFPAGTYKCNFSTPVSILGVGSESILITANAGTAIITLTGATGSYDFRRLGGFYIDGDSFASDGIDFGSTSQYSGRWAFDNIFFFECDKAIRKRRGHIGNRYTLCTFAACNYGIHATGNVTGDAMHVGADKMDHCELHSMVFAAIYLDGNTAVEAGMFIFSSTVFEGNTGMAIFIKSFGQSYTPIEFRNCWFEANASDGSVTIDTVAYTPRDIYAKDCDMITMNNSKVEDIELVNSSMYITSSNYNVNTEFTLDADSSLVNDKAYSDDAEIEVDSVIGALRGLGSQAPTLITKPKNALQYTLRTGTVLAGNSFANAESYAFGGTTAETGRTAPDGLIFQSCCELLIPAGNSQVFNSVTATIDKYYVFSLDYSLTDSANINIAIKNGIVLWEDSDQGRTSSDWISIAGIGKCISGGSAALFLTNSSGGGVTVRLSAYQLVEFDTFHAAVDFFNQNVFILDDVPREMWGSAAPTTGTWVQGDRVYDIAPAASSFIGWVCTAGGSPGTWKTFGATSA